MAKMATVKIDGLPVEVDAAEYNADPGGVEARVRAARAEVRMDPLEEDETREPSYTELYGKDGATNG
jgi:hypothetical protein